jgi:hypothetical protein
MVAERVLYIRVGLHILGLTYVPISDSVESRGGYSRLEDTSFAETDHCEGEYARLHWSKRLFGHQKRKRNRSILRTGSRGQGPKRDLGSLIETK